MQIIVNNTCKYSWVQYHMHGQVHLTPVTEATSSAGGGSSGCSVYIIRQPPATRLGWNSGFWWHLLKDNMTLYEGTNNHGLFGWIVNA